MIENILRERKMSVAELARRIQATGFYVSRATLHKYKRLPYFPDYMPLGLLRAMALVFDIPVSDLLALDNNVRARKDKEKNNTFQ